MYTITRKIAVVCLAVVFSVLVYGCGGGDNQQASTDTPSTDTPDQYRWYGWYGYSGWYGHGDDTYSRYEYGDGRTDNSGRYLYHPAGMNLEISTMLPLHVPKRGCPVR